MVRARSGQQHGAQPPLAGLHLPALVRPPGCGRFPRLYGKVQAPQPARWLSYEEAFERLIGACRDGTDLGLRDEAIIRLGLAGMRAAEIIHLSMANRAVRQRLYVRRQNREGCQDPRHIPFGRIESDLPWGNLDRSRVFHPVAVQVGGPVPHVLL